MTKPLTHQARSTYRALLRELPGRKLTAPSPLHQRLRTLFRPQEQTPSTPACPSQTSQFANTSHSSEVPLPFSIPTSAEDQAIRLQEASQMAQYAKAQRTYAALLERYNPGMHLEEEERIRLTARRVGFDLPQLHNAEGEKPKE
ncbi:hypothetical protein N7462_006976 [Penicillium macrosclerotiorum]|uniref:uncharacterized protein n=1 Tax=Penicillium macrosclerotiorum TaxID=303699 RepID=UPI0025465DE7|nr:uncharacterized protein N7462_006976 [Penicillium macrosclerotiorum]KAJ5678732.1 hypothetical protein N7462_006976 [Penicillium macrosclerotiorum]